MFRPAALALLFAGSAAGAAPACGAACNDGKTICDPTAECNLCMPSPPDQNATYACMAGCSNPCTADDNCGDKFCFKCTNGTCGAPPAPPVPPAPTPPPVVSACLGPCGDFGKHVCDAASECPLCIEVVANTTYKCGVGCNTTACTSDDQCLEPGCNKCVNNRCIIPAGPPPPPPATSGCLGPCGDFGKHVCDAAGECPLCIGTGANGSAPYQCGVGCNTTACTSDDQCLEPNCGKCISGRCQIPAPPPPPAAKCNAPCTTNDQCTLDAECSICVPKTSTEFMCSAPCTKPCTSDAHCGVTNCMRCVNGTCAR